MYSDSFPHTNICFLACSRLSVSGAYRMRPGDVRRAGSGRERGKVSFPRPLFFSPEPARPAPAFRSTPLTESLEQAICFSEPTQTGSFEEQIVSSQRYPSILSPQRSGGFCVYQVFFKRFPQLTQFSKLRINTWLFPNFSHVTRLDQSGARENVRHI